MRKARGKIALLLAAALVVTGIQVPVYGATEDNVAIVEEETVEEETVEEETVEEFVGADSTIYVRSAAELIAALNGIDADGKELPTNEALRIQMQTPLTGYDYKLTKELLGAQNLMIKEGLEITLDVNNNRIYLSEDAADYCIEVPKDTSFRIENGRSETETLTVNEMRIVNNGDLAIVDIEVNSQYGDGIVNHAGATAYLENAGVTSETQDTVAIRNAGTMSIGDWSQILATSGSCIAIENTGDLVLNRSFVFVTNQVNVGVGCAIANRTSAATLNIRGGEVEPTTSYGIYNDAGFVTVGGYAIAARDTSNCFGGRYGIFTVNGGTVISYNDSSIISVATTPFAGNEVFTGTTDGYFKMLGGEVDRITYSVDSLPILMGGTVGYKNYPNQYALEVLKGPNTRDFDPSKHCYLTEEGGVPVAGSYLEGDRERVAYLIMEGKVCQSETADTPILVNTEAELRDAVTVGGKIDITGDISLSQELVLAKDVSIDLENNYLKQGTQDGAITVGEGVHAEFYGDSNYRKGIVFENMQSGASAITNHGDLVFSGIGVKVGGVNNDVTGAKAITNNGSVQITGIPYYDDWGERNVCDASFEMNVKDGIIIDNAGTCTLQEGAKILGAGDNIAHVKAVYNTGKFIMNGGIVRAVNANADTGRDNYAIVYTGDNYPILRSGSVYGEGREFEDTPIYGSAVVQDDGNGNYSRGYFKISDSVETVKVDGENSCYIEDGLPYVTWINDIEDEYLSLEKGDVVSHIETAFDINEGSNWNYSDYPCYTYGTYTYSITSSDPTVASVVSSNNAGETAWTLNANKAGYTTLQATAVFDGNHVLESYLRIEVTDDKSVLTADDYTGSLLENQIVVNAYASDSQRHHVPFEFHLNTSDMATGAQYDDFDAAKEKSFEVKEIVIDDKEFNKYFKISPIYTNGTESQIYFAFKNRESQNGASTKLLDDEVKSINQVEVKALISSEASNKEILIPLGSLDIGIQAEKPAVKVLSGFTLNSAYAATSEYIDMNLQELIHPNLQWIYSFKENITAAVNGEEITDIEILKTSLSEGLCWDENSFNCITAIAKKGKESINADVSLEGYVGTYQVRIPVTVTNKYPKVTLDKKTVTVAQQASAELDIPLTFRANDAESVGEVQSVEVVTAKGKTSNYAVNYAEFGYAYYNETQKSYESGVFYLQPKSVVNQAETVTLKVTYKDTCSKAGKAYSTTVKVKIKPVNKFTIKQNGKASLCTNSGNSTTVAIKTTPEYFDGAKLIVTALKGQAVIPEEVAGATIHNYGRGTHEVEVTTKEGTKARGKKLEFGVAWVDENGKILTGTKVAKMSVSLFEDTSQLLTTEAAITVQPEKIYKTYKVVNGNVEAQKNQFTTSVKYTGKGNWSMTDYSDSMFDICYSGKKLVLEASEKVVAGTICKIPLEFANANTGEKQIVNLTVNVADVKKVSAKFDKDTVTLYQKAPYTADTVRTAAVYPYVTAPTAGVGVTEITKVEIVDAENSPFEIFERGPYTAYPKVANDVECERMYLICFKDKKYPTKATAKALKSVTVKITYGNGIDDNYKTAFVKLKVNIK